MRRCAGVLVVAVMLGACGGKAKPHAITGDITLGGSDLVSVGKTCGGSDGYSSLIAGADVIARQPS